MGAGPAGTFAPITTCNSGTNCWKTDLDNTYNASSSQDLLSPSIDLTGHVGPVLINWAQKYQMESATFDHMNVDIVSPATRLFEWLGATMTKRHRQPDGHRAGVVRLEPALRPS